MMCIPLVSTVAVLLLARIKAHEDSNCSFPVPSIRWSSPVSVRISDGLFETLQGKCVGGNAALLTTGLRLTYEIKKYNQEQRNYSLSNKIQSDCISLFHMSV